MMSARCMIQKMEPIPTKCELPEEVPRDKSSWRPQSPCCYKDQGVVLFSVPLKEEKNSSGTEPPQNHVSEKSICYDEENVRQSKRIFRSRASKTRGMIKSLSNTVITISDEEDEGQELTETLPSVQNQVIVHKEMDILYEIPSSKEHEIQTDIKQISIKTESDSQCRSLQNKDSHTEMASGSAVNESVTWTKAENCAFNHNNIESFNQHKTINMTNEDRETCDRSNMTTDYKHLSVGSGSKDSLPTTTTDNTCYIAISMENSATMTDNTGYIAVPRDNSATMTDIAGYVAMPRENNTTMTDNTGYIAVPRVNCATITDIAGNVAMPRDNSTTMNDNTGYIVIPRENSVTMTDNTGYIAMPRENSATITDFAGYVAIPRENSATMTDIAGYVAMPRENSTTMTNNTGYIAMFRENSTTMNDNTGYISIPRENSATMTDNTGYIAMPRENSATTTDNNGYISIPRENSATITDNTGYIAMPRENSATISDIAGYVAMPRENSTTMTNNTGYIAMFRENSTTMNDNTGYISIPRENSATMTDNTGYIAMPRENSATISDIAGYVAMPRENSATITDNTGYIVMPRENSATIIDNTGNIETSREDSSGLYRVSEEQLESELNVSEKCNSKKQNQKETVDNMEMNKSHEKEQVRTPMSSWRNKKRECLKCGKMVKNMSFRNHRLTHEDPKYECEICQRKFTLGHYYKRHMLTHKGYSKFKINQLCRPAISSCKLVQSFSSELQKKRQESVKKRTPNKETPISLDRSSSCFVTDTTQTPGARKVHGQDWVMKKLKTNTKNRKLGYSCDKCKGLYSRRWTLNRHIKSQICLRTNCANNTRPHSASKTDKTTDKPIESVLNNNRPNSITNRSGSFTSDPENIQENSISIGAAYNDKHSFTDPLKRRSSHFLTATHSNNQTSGAGKQHPCDRVIKKFTLEPKTKKQKPKYSCHMCKGLYSRRWTLNRHLKSQICHTTNSASAAQPFTVSKTVDGYDSTRTDSNKNGLKSVINKSERFRSEQEKTQDASGNMRTAYIDRYSSIDKNSLQSSLLQSKTVTHRKNQTSGAGKPPPCDRVIKMLVLKPKTKKDKPKYSCHICKGIYSRRWTLNRHLKLQICLRTNSGNKTQPQSATKKEERVESTNIKPNEKRLNGSGSEPEKTQEASVNMRAVPEDGHNLFINESVSCMVTDTNSKKQTSETKSFWRNQKRECFKCGKMVKNMSFRNHRLSHEDPKFECDICPRKFTLGHYYKRHMLIHKEYSKGKMEHSIRPAISSKKVVPGFSSELQIIHEESGKKTTPPKDRHKFINIDSVKSGSLHYETGTNDKTAKARKDHAQDRVMKKLKTNHHTENSELGYSCDKCKGIFSRRWTLNRHIKSQICLRTNGDNETQPHSANGAEEEVPSQNSAANDIHASDKQKEKDNHYEDESRYDKKCPVCGINIQHDYFLSHMVTHEECDGFLCEICGLFYKSRCELSKHQLLHGDERQFVCHICSQRYQTNAALKGHLTVKHSNSQSTLEKEKECIQTPAFSTIGDVTCNIQAFNSNKQHNKDMNEKLKYPCPIGLCGMQFNHKKKLKIHVNWHKRNEHHRSRICHHCGKTITTYQKLEEHQKYHCGNGKKLPRERAKCDICGKELYKNTLKLHIKRVHQGKHSYVTCQICGKSVKKFTMHVHIKTHEDPQYRCCDCGKLFTLKHQLRNHMLAHGDTRKFECTFCPLKFKMAHHLRSHLKTQHGK